MTGELLTPKGGDGDSYELDHLGVHSVWVKVGGLDVNIETHPVKGLTVDIHLYDEKSGGEALGRMLGSAHARQP